jgi:hypothetical protein
MLVMSQVRAGVHLHTVEPISQLIPAFSSVN